MDDSRQEIIAKLKFLSRVSKGQKINVKDMILQDEDCSALRQLCKWSFDPKIESELPSGTPPYIENEAPEGTEHMLLRTEGDKLYHYIKGADPNLQGTVRERMFIRLLEGLHKDEAKLLCLVKEKKLHRDKEGGYKGLSAKVVKDAFGWDEDFQEYK